MLLSLVLLTAAIADGQPAQSAREAGERAADSRDKVICKRFVETGSLVRGYKTCKTKAEWERDRDIVRQNARSGAPCRGMGQGLPC